MFTFDSPRSAVHDTSDRGHGCRYKKPKLERTGNATDSGTRYQEFDKPEFERLAGISVSHLYNLRQSAPYGKHAAVFEPTRPNPVSIAERRRPDPQGRPGFLRVDTVHQGDWDGAKGVYHINAVDTVTQWQVVGCVSKISEQFLIPVLEAMLQQFPFGILGFHSDNGSEFINRRVAELLEKLLIEFTKSRASRTQDNALVEGKNGAPLCASSSGTVTLPASMPKRCRSSIPHT